MKKFTCIFPGLYNYILTKDVGMIPYTLSSEYDTKIVTYNNDDYTYMNSLLLKDNFNLEYLDNTGNQKKDIVNYIKDNAKDIDIIQFYHLRYNELPLYVFFYKLYNRKGHIYLKLDSNNEMIDFLVKRKGFLPSIRRLFMKIVFRFIDTISIETKHNYNTLKESHLINKDSLIYIPNGIMSTEIPINKEKIILYVGNIEKKNKRIDKLIDTVKKIDLKGWKLVLIGEIKEDIQEYFIEDMKPIVEYKGYISDKKKLAEEYSKASIYCCLSEKESFGISTLEAAYHGNYIISTDVGGSTDILEKTEYGKIINNNLDNLPETLQETINNWETIEKDPNKNRKIINQTFNYNNICEELIKKFEK